MTGSWVVSDKSTGRAIVEIFDAERAAQVNPEKFLVEPISRYLGRVSREIKEKQSNPERLQKRCEACCGTGEIPSDDENLIGFCSVCNGEGMLP